MYKISGRVLLNGSPVQNAKVIAVSTEDKIYLNDILTDKDGYYTVLLQEQKKCHVMVEYEDENGQKYNAFSKWDVLPVLFTTLVNLPIDLEIVISPLNRDFILNVTSEANSTITTINKIIEKEILLSAEVNTDSEDFGETTITELSSAIISPNRTCEKEAVVETDIQYSVHG